MDQIEVNFHFSVLRSGLQSSVILSPLPSATRPWQMVLLQSGAVSTSIPGEAFQETSLQLEAPALLCWPTEQRRHVKLLAGSSGVHIAVGEMFLISVLGNRPEAAELREMVREFAVLDLANLRQLEARFTSVLSEIAQEHERAESGQLVIIEAQLRCLIIHLWRHTHKTNEASASSGQQTILLRRFRRLVETHYRDRWRVRDYASALNTTPDRLHNISTQTLQRSPLALIHDRCHREARALLTRTNMSLDQIAEHLNFKTTPQFSSFFRKLEGIPPGRYRSQATSAKAEGSPHQDVEFSDWP